ncbi:uncharacterized protein LOC115218370 isoform X1 [Octopus sinensis]|uniref:Uncharacterized protein LOC115218370 isoform X1 n=1 Tax=Octopus sinensis TaxID=2607531 RepID=A0A6P7T0V7_9MOLL|nr:uncharacterized protein LOC115218370 isoform X1 [Octopus sinensis]
MADMNLIADGRVKYRDGKKWKLRWCAVRMPSPVADRLQVYLYKDCKDALKDGNAKNTFPLEGFYGIESGFTYEKEDNVMAIICQKSVILMSFESRELMIHFELRIRRCLGEEHQYRVRILKVPQGSKLPLENVRMHIHHDKFCLAAYIPPKMLQSWRIHDLRRFGVVEGKFVFEGGSRCRKGSGVHIIATEQGEEVAEIFQAASEGKPTAGERKWPVMLRRSQINEFLDSPFKSQYSDTPSSTSSVEMDSRSNDSEWRKRHSISAADYGWAQGYGEKNKLISIENLENEARDHLLAIYDIPPRRIRKVEFLSPNRNSLQPSPNRNTLIPHLTEGSTNSKLSSVDNNSKNYFPNANRNGNQYHSFESFMPSPTNGNTHYENEITTSTPFPGGSVIDTEIDRATTQTRRQDAQNKLHKEEQNLQREITLLDEMLQVWQLEETKPNGGQTQPKYVVSMQGQPMLQNKKSYQNTNAWVDANFTDNDVQFRSNSCSLNNAPSSNRTSTGYWDSGMLSPNLLSKLNKIPQNSQLAAPLPYVNLEKYDVGDDRRHLSVSSNESADILLPDTRSQNYDNLNLEYNHPPLPNKTQQQIDYHNNIYFPQQDSKAENISQNVNSPKTEDCSREYSPPPKLPPKGPLLQNRNRQRQLLPSINNPVSPVPHISRRHTMSPDSSSSSDLSPYHMSHIGNPSSVRLKDQDNNSDDSYFMMSGFAKEEKCEESDLLKSPILPHGNSNMTRAYMDMTGKFEIPTGFPPPPCPSTHNSPGRTSIYEPNITQCCAPPPPLSTMPAEMMRSQPIATGNPEENYMEMGGSPKKSATENFQTSNISICSNPSSPTLFSKDITTSLSSDFSSSSSLSTNCNPVPFPNLKNFQILNNEKSNDGSGNNQSANKGTNKDKHQENNMKAPGFFSRLIRRNSKDQTKNSSLSQENLASSNSPVDRTSSVGLPCNPVTVENVESVPPEQGQSLGERQRSSSFPSENCYQDMVPELPKCNPSVDQKQTAGYPPLPFSCHRSGTSSCSPNSNNTTPTKCHNCQQSFSQMKCNYKMQPCSVSHSACQSPSKESHLDTANQNLKQISSMSFESNDHENYSSDVSDSYIFMGPLFGKEEIPNEISSNSPTNTLNDPCTKNNVLTAYPVSSSGGGEEVMPPEQFQTNNSSKTDDEKLLELYQLGKSQLKEESFEPAVTTNTSELKDKLSLPLNPAITPDEQAAAIARHVAGLPPFIPPKTKSHPCSLSPVFESNPCLTPEVTGIKLKYEPEFQEIPEPFQLKDLSDYVQQKQQVQSSLRIAPASDPLVEESVWIPRTTDATEDESSQTSEAKQLRSNDASPQDDEPLLTPNAGTVESLSAEDAVRSSPASTILRPRSGKDYQLVERKKSIDGCSADTGSPQTPQSASAGLVFTFDNLPQAVSNNINNNSPPPQNENPAYVNLGRDPDTHESVSSYVNIDMTPPCSPFTSVDQPEPLLNYAEIDLSSNFPNGPTQMKATNPRDSIIDYATIDMVATVAAQKAGEEHAQSRGECFQASNRKYSAANLSKDSKSITGHLKERKSSSVSD